MKEKMDMTIDQESRNMALLIWIGTIFFGFIPGLVFYLVKKDDSYIVSQAKESLNWSITALISYAAGLILSMILIGVLVLFALAICHLTFCVMGAVACSDGKDFKVPYTLRLVK